LAIIETCARAKTNQISRWTANENLTYIPMRTDSTIVLSEVRVLLVD